MERDLTRALIAVVALSVAFFPSPRASAQKRRMTDSTQNKRAAEAVLRAERETMAAIREKNARALGRILTDDFVYRTPAGAEMGKAEFLKTVTSMPAQILSVEGEQLRVSLFGETAVLTGVQRARARTEEGVEAVSLVAFTDVFIKRGGRWRLALAYGVEILASTTETPPEQ